PGWPTPTVAAAGAVIEGVPDCAVTLTAIDCGAALLPKLSPALSVIVSAAVLASVSVRVPRSVFTCASEPVIDRLAVPDPDTPLPLADSLPLASARVTVKLSLAVLPLSERLMPEIALAWFCATVAEAGAAMTGSPLTVTAIVAAVALPPLLSLALSAIVSDGVVASVSVRVARSLSTCASEPVIVRLVVPDPDTPVPVADNSPCVSASVAVKVSPLVVGDTDLLTPAIAPGCPTPTVAAAGAVIEGVPDCAVTLTAIDCGAALLPKLSPALSVIVSAAVLASVSVRVPRSVLTCASEPVIDRLAVPDPDTPLPLADSLPLASARVTVKLSLAVLPLSDRLTPEIALAWFCATVAEAGAAMTGSPLTVTAIVAAVALPPLLSLALSAIVSDGVVASVSVRVARSLSTCASEPVIVRLVVPDPDTPVPVAASSPCVSARVAVKVSPLVVGDSAMLTPAIAPGCPTPTVAAAGAVIEGVPDCAVTLTAIDCGAALLPKLSPALSVIVSAAVAASASGRVARSLLTCASEPVIERLVVPDPDTPLPLADSLPLASASVTVKLSPAVLPLSDRLTPEIALAWFCATVAVVGAATTGSPLTVTAIVAAVALPPLLSLALSAIVSDGVVASASVRVARSLSTCASEPVIVRLVVPDPDTPVPVADNSPFVSARVAVNVSPLVVGDSAMLIPLIAPGWPTPTVAAAGAVIEGVPDCDVTLTAIVCCAALLPKLPLALSVIVSAAVDGSLSVRVPRSVLTCASEPVIDRLAVPDPDTPLPLADSLPLASARVTVKLSLAVLPLSERLMPEIALAWFCATVAEAGAAMTGSPLTVTAIVAAVALPPLLSLALSAIVSDGVVASVSVRVARSLSTCASEPVIVRLVVPDPDTPVPVAASSPFASARVAVKVS